MFAVYMVYPIYNSRDAIVGTKYQPASKSFDSVEEAEQHLRTVQIDDQDDDLYYQILFEVDGRLTPVSSPLEFSEDIPF